MELISFGMAIVFCAYGNYQSPSARHEKGQSEAIGLMYLTIRAYGADFRFRIFGRDFTASFASRSARAASIAGLGSGA